MENIDNDCDSNNKENSDEEYESCEEYNSDNDLDSNCDEKYDQDECNIIFCNSKDICTSDGFCKEHAHHTTNFKNKDDKKFINSHKSNMTSLFRTTIGKSNKVKIITDMYVYLLYQKEFVNNHTIFKNMCNKKANEFENDNLSIENYKSNLN